MQNYIFLNFPLDNRTNVLLSLIASGCTYPSCQARKTCHCPQANTSHTTRKIRIITTASRIILKPLCRNTTTVSRGNMASGGLCRKGDLPFCRLRRSAPRLCPCQMQRLRPRIPAGLLLQAPPFLPVLPPEARGGIRGVALHGCPQAGAAPSFHLQHPEDSWPVFLV